MIMAKFLNKKIEVRQDRKNNPAAFRVNEAWFPVSEVLEVWKDTGTWWDGEMEKTFYRVEGANGSLYELYRDIGGRAWFLYKIYD